MTEIDIWRSAHLLAKQHGERAEFIATGRIDDMIAHSDAAGEATWKRILAAVRAMQRVAPGNGDQVH